MADMAINKSEDNAENKDAKVVDKALAEKIIKQCEFYYGDINLSRDKFLQEQMKLDDGWVPIEVMLRFNRLKTICGDANIVAAALGNSSLIEVDASNTKIRRKPTRPIQTLSKENVEEQKLRSVYAKGFPADSTLDQLQEFFEKYGKTDLIVMRRDKKKDFKESCFVVFESKEGAEKFLSEPDLKYNDRVLVREFKHDYYQRKTQERKAEEEERRKTKQELRDKEDREFASKQIVLGTLLRVSNMPASANIEEIRTLFSKYGQVKWIDFEKDTPSSEAIIRFGEENSAKAALKTIADESEGKLTFKDVELDCSVLEGEAEQEHWKNLVRMKKDRADRGKNGFGRKRGGGHGGRPKFNRRRNDDDGPNPKKRKMDGDDNDGGNSSDGVGNDSD